MAIKKTKDNPSEICLCYLHHSLPLQSLEVLVIWAIFRTVNTGITSSKNFKSHVLWTGLGSSECLGWLRALELYEISTLYSEYINQARNRVYENSFLPEKRAS